jgi:hypothetical protein
VTCLGPGFGWTGRCIAPGEAGNSFAAPAISTTLMLAKTYWSSLGERLDAVQARRRLLLAARPVAKFQQYASMGVPTLARLLLRRGTYALTASGAPQRLDKLKGRVAFTVAGESEERVLPFRAGAVAGVQFDTAGDFVFIDGQAEIRWRPARVTRLELTYEQGNQTVPLDRSSFTHLEGLIAL